MHVGTRPRKRAFTVPAPWSWTTVEHTVAALVSLYEGKLDEWDLSVRRAAAAAARTPALSRRTPDY